MTRRLLALVLLLIAALSVATPALAITDGVVDGSAHPEVGGLIATQAYSDGTWVYCSGTLISPTVFLTAAHCAEGGDDRVRVSFSSAYHDGDMTYAGTFHADPAYSQQQSDPHDIAVVVLDKAVKGIASARLPAADSLSGLTHGQPITSVGYGAHDVTSGPGGHEFLYDDVRMVASGGLDSVTPSWLRVSMNASTGDGGTCYGDSGGPNFLGGSNVVAATTITGDAICRATNVDYRLDTPGARAFLGQWVRLP
jgi:secreted trypsin-like serine protease